MLVIYNYFNSKAYTLSQLLERLQWVVLPRILYTGQLILLCGLVLFAERFRGNARPFWKFHSAPLQHAVSAKGFVSDARESAPWTEGDSPEFCLVERALLYLQDTGWNRDTCKFGIAEGLLPDEL